MFYSRKEEMTKYQIEKHEILKQAALFSYDVNKNKIPNGYHLVGISTHDNGFYACVLKKGNDVIIAYRGSNDKQDWLGSNKDMFFKKFPEQTKNALSLYDQIHNEYPNCNIELTGHSLGGSLAQIIGVKRKIYTVTFNAYGTKNLFLNQCNTLNNNITNYCNPKDWVTTRNAKNHIGKCYEINSKPDAKNSHNIESMQPLTNRIPTTSEELQGAWHKKIREQEELEFYRRTCPH